MGDPIVFQAAGFGFFSGKRSLAAFFLKVVAQHFSTLLVKKGLLKP